MIKMRYLLLGARAHNVAVEAAEAAEAADRNLPVGADNRAIEEAVEVEAVDGADGAVALKGKPEKPLDQPRTIP